MKQMNYSINKLKKIIREEISKDTTDSGTFYVASSSYDSESSYYSIEKVIKAVKRAGGENVRVEKVKGHEDEVVVFDALVDVVEIEDVAKEVAQSLKTDWVYINKMAR